jgi:DNA-binding protein H-NS
MQFDLNQMTLAELKQLQKQLDSAISNYQDRKLREAKQAVEEKLQEFGYKLEDITGVKSTATRAPAVAKYSHPENPSITWSGRGRKPKWIDEHLRKGHSLDDLLIKQ